MSSHGHLQIATELARVFGEAGISYAFIHGLERFPACVGRDLDVLVPHDHVARAIASAERHFRGRQWRFVAHRRLNGSAWCFVAPPLGRTVFEFDLVPRLRWGPAIFVDQPTSLSRHGAFNVDAWATFVKRVLVQLLGGNIAKLEEAPHDLALGDDERDHVQRMLPRFLGQPLAESLLRAVDARDIGELRRLVPRLRKAVLLHSLMRPGSMLPATADWIRNELAVSPIARRVIPVLAIVGVDGVGKSTLVGHLTRELRERLPVIDVVTRHWRPSLIPRLGRLLRGHAPIDDGVPAPPRRSPGRFGMLRLAYYAVDFCIGGWWRDRPAAAQLRAIVYDRCILDMLIDPVRFGLKTSFGVNLVRRIAGGPEFVVLLHDNPLRVSARKRELHVSEITEQQSRWRALAARGDVHLVLTVDEPPEILATKVVDGLIDRFFGTRAPDGPGSAVDLDTRRSTAVTHANARRGL